jgi:uncharacterized membrane protein YdbT with pleckstrin-like domain
MFRNSPLGFIVSLVLVPVFGLGIIVLIWWALKCKATKISVSDTELIFEQGLLSKAKVELSLSNIRTVKLNQSFGQRIFGTGDIEVFTSGDAPEVMVAGMPRPHELKGLLKGT